MSTSNQRSRADKITIQPPSAIPRLTPDHPLLLKDKIPQLLDHYRPLFNTKLHLQALSLEGRQLGILLHNKAVVSHFFNAVGFRHVQNHPNGDPHRRIVVLNVKAGDELPTEVQTQVEELHLEVLPFTVQLGWDSQSSDSILEYILPSELVRSEGVPTGFTIVGHIAHLNLIDLYLPFRYLVGSVILEKNKTCIRTVVNKLDSIDTQFRFFKMELLAGEEDYIAQVSESECTFTFDFRTVYWNSRLHGEHDRLINKFRPNEVVVDVMAGVGPFAVPAAKRSVWVLANDLNPKSYESLVQNGKTNHVLESSQDGDKRDNTGFDGGILAFCQDGRGFVRESIKMTWKAAFRGRPSGFTDDDKLRDYGKKIVKARQKAKRGGIAPQEVIEREPPHKMVDHFVMNLPASALEFLDAFRGAYTELAEEVGMEEVEKEMTRRGEDALPWVHVHCFSKDPLRPGVDLLNRANKALGIPDQAEYKLISAPILAPQTSRRSNRIILPPTTTQEGLDKLTTTSDLMSYLTNTSLSGQTPTPDLSIHYVRDVAPNKQMYCISFRVPRQVLFVH